MPSLASIPSPAPQPRDAEPAAAFEALVRGRRSVHAFDPAPIADEDVRASLELALLAPSSFNLQPYEFVRVRDPERRRELARLCLGQRPAQTAQELIVCVARWDRSTCSAGCARSAGRSSPRRVFRRSTARGRSRARRWRAPT